jgi:hypothetical protein
MSQSLTPSQIKANLQRDISVEIYKANFFLKQRLDDKFISQCAQYLLKLRPETTPNEVESIIDGFTTEKLKYNDYKGLLPNLLFYLNGEHKKIIDPQIQD